MKKIIIFLLLTVVMQQVTAQTETFDVTIYTAPKDFKKENRPGAMVYSQANEVTGHFCAIIIFAGADGSGDVVKDFKSQWDELAVKKYAAVPDPKTEKAQSPEGWNTLTGASLIKIEGTDAYIFITVFSGFGKRITIVSTLNDQSYIPVVDAFLSTVKIDKAAFSKQKNSITIPSSTGKTTTGIMGTWSDYSGVMANYVNSSGMFLSSADTHEMHQYEFTDNNNFSYQYLGSMGSTMLYEKSSGTYSIQGDKLILVIKMYASCMGAKGMTGKMKEDKDKEITETYTFYIGANKWEPGPFLNMHKEGNYYPWSDFPYDYYKKVNTGTATTNNTPEVNQKNTSTENNTQQFGTVLYTPPVNWKLEKYTDGDILLPADIPTGQFLEIWVMPSMNFSGTMEQALQKSYDETIAKLKATKMNEVNGGNYSIVPAKKSFRGWEYIRGSGGIHLGEGEYPPEFGLDIFVIKINNRFEQIAVLKKRGNCDYSSYYPTDKLKYYNDVENFLFSLQFPDWKEPVVKPGIVKGDGIIGVWQGIGLSVGMAKPGAALGAELKVKDAIFFSNGQVYFGTRFPIEGLDELNTWVKAEQNRRDWGTYTFTNGKGIIKLPYADIPLQMEGNELTITTNKTDHNYIKINTVDGAAFNGTYAFSSKDFAGNETGKTPLINFTSNGKFSDNGAITIMNHSIPGCLNDAAYPGEGTYEIKNHTVTFKYNDGRKIKIAFIGSDFDKNNQSPGKIALSFNEDLFLKK